MNLASMSKVMEVSDRQIFWDTLDTNSILSYTYEYKTYKNVNKSDPKFIYQNPSRGQKGTCKDADSCYKSSFIAVTFSENTIIW